MKDKANNGKEKNSILAIGFPEHVLKQKAGARVLAPHPWANRHILFPRTRESFENLPNKCRSVETHISLSRPRCGGSYAHPYSQLTQKLGAFAWAVGQLLDILPSYLNHGKVPLRKYLAEIPIQALLRAKQIHDELMRASESDRFYCRAGPVVPYTMDKPLFVLDKTRSEVSCQLGN